MLMSSPKSHIHWSLIMKQWSSSQSSSNNERKGPDSVLFPLAGASRKHLSLSGCCRLSCSGPGQSWFGIIPSWMWGSPRLRGSNEQQLECIWYYLMQRTGSLSEALMCFCSQTSSVTLNADGSWRVRWDTLMWGRVSLPWWFTDTA